MAVRGAAGKSGGDAWEWTGGPAGAVVAGLLTTPRGTLLAGTESGGLYRSEDGGDSWTQADPSLAWPCCNYSLNTLAAGDQAVYVGTWGGGVWRSDDDGLTWYATGTIPGDDYPIVRALAVCHYGDVVFAGGNFGVVRSDDGGATWVEDEDGLPGEWVRSLALRGLDLFAQFDGAVYRRDPQTGLWSLFEDGLLAPWGQESLTVTPETVLLAGHEGGVYHLDCDDQQWTPLNDDLWYDNVNAVVQVDRVLFAGTMGEAVFRRDPATRAWAWRGDGIWNGDVRAMTARGLTPYAGTYGAGVFRFDPAADVWSEAVSGMASPFVRDIVVSGGVVYAGMFGGGIAVSADQGDTWLPTVDAVMNVFVHELEADAGGVCAGTWNGVWRTEDQGANWQAVGLQGEGIFSLDCIEGRHYAGTYGGAVWHWAEGDEAWTQLGSGLPSACVQGVVLLEGVYYAALGGAGVYALPEGNAVWTDSGAGLPGPDCWSLAASGGNLFVAVGNDGVWRWNAPAGAWEATALDGGWILRLADLDGLLAAGTWGALWTSADGGQTWQDAGSGLTPWLAVQAIASGDGRGYVGLDGGGVFRTTSATPVAEPEPFPSAASPADGLTVRPNPLRGEAQIFFTLARAGRAELVVYDLAGRAVRTLHAGDLPAGPSVLAWDGAVDGGGRAAAGVYLLRLRADGRELVTKSINLR
ncbi:MAG: hypothetical protein C0395_10140 [Gemmatimonas sp.]|nr:hypothetical protein [Gemmatimonas sp.]